MSSEDRPVELVSGKEEAGVARNLFKFLNSFPDIPVSIERIDYEFMPDGKVSMAFSLVQSTYIVERFINGAYIAECQFKIIYRAKPGTPNARLSADELLDSFGEWVEGKKPFIGEGMEVQEFEPATSSALFARMVDGWEDHQIFMRMTYKVEPQKVRI